MTDKPKRPKSPEYLAWEARRAECLRIGHVWEGGTCKHCGVDKHGAQQAHA
jgi:hypothetical protein